MTKKYSEDSIQRYAGLLGIRKKPTPYIGPADSDGLWTIWREPADNCVDQALAGRNKLVHLIEDPTPGRFWVLDGGEGIPVKEKVFENEHGKKEKHSTLYVVTGLTHGGSNFDSDQISRGCFVGDTKVKLLDGTSKTFKQLYDEWNIEDKSQRPKNHVYSIDPATGERRFGEITHVQLSKYVKRLAVVTLDNGKKIKSTVNHPYYVNDPNGRLTKVRADTLKPGDSLASLYLRESKYLGFRGGKADGVTGISHMEKMRPVHRAVYRQYHGEIEEGFHVHHKDENVYNNDPSNLEALHYIEHHAEHAEEKRALWSRLNANDNVIDAQQVSKARRILMRMYHEGEKPNAAAYEAYYLHGAMGWSALRGREDFQEIKASAVAHYRELHAADPEGLDHYLSYAVAVAADVALMANARAAAKKARANLNGAAPTMENVNRFSRGVQQWKSYSLIMSWMTEGEFARYCRTGECDVHADLSESARTRRMLAYEARTWSEDYVARSLRAFGVWAKRHQPKSWADVEANRPRNLAMTCKLRHMLRLNGYVGYDGLKAWLSEFNHSVRKVEIIDLETEVPVYGITVDDDHTYAIEPGVFVGNTHGIGIKATNAMSKVFTVWTFRDGAWWCIEYRDAKMHKAPYKSKNAPKMPHGIKPKKGTVVMFEPDLKLFHKGSSMQRKRALEWCEVTSYLVKGLEVKFTTKEGKTKTYKTAGPQEFLAKQIERAEVTQTGKTFLFSSKEADIAIGFTDAEGDDLVAAYTNGLHNKEGGEHVRALQRALLDSLEDFQGDKSAKSKAKAKKQAAKKKGKRASKKEGPAYTVKDLCDGLMGLVNYKIAAPQFNNQPKDKLSDARVYDVAYPQFKAALVEFWDKNKGMAKDVIARATLLRSKTASFLNDKKLVKNVNAARKGMSVKLAGVIGTAPVAERELFIVEGDSAGGSAKQARDKSFQAVYPLKGKPLNVMEAKSDKVNANNEVVGLLAALGIDMSGKKANPDIAYGKVILLADADVDGPLVGSTRVKMCDGTTKTMKELADRWDATGKPAYVWSMTRDGRVVPAKAVLPTQVAVKKKLVKITFDDGTVHKCSLNHKWPINGPINGREVEYRNGIPFVRADDLESGDSILSVYFERAPLNSSQRVNRNKYLRYINPFTGKKHFLHRAVMEYVDPKAYSAYKKANRGVMGGEVHIHHKNENPLDNRPRNLTYVGRREHFGIHGREMALAYNGSEKHLADLRRWWAENPDHAKVTSRNITAYNKSEAHAEANRRTNRNPEFNRIKTLSRAARIYKGLVKLGVEPSASTWDLYRPRVSGNWISFSMLEQKGISLKMLRKHARRLNGYRKMVLREEAPVVSYPSQCLSKFLAFAKVVFDKKGFVNGKVYTKLRRRGIDRRVIAQGTPTWERGFSDFGQSLSKLNDALKTYNHSVAKVEIIKCDPTPVYCMAVPEHGNFLIEDKRGNGIATGNSHINTLILGVLYKFVPTLLKEGRVFSVRSPLYKGNKGTQVFFGMTKDEVLKKAGGKADLTYLKGWGEVNPEDLGVALDPQLRTLIKIEDAEAKGRKAFEQLLGKNVAFRKQLLGVE